MSKRGIAEDPPPTEDEALPNATNPSAKRRKLNPVDAMMEKMGFQQGKGLGKHGQGIVQPIEASDQRGRRGLGFSASGLEPKTDLFWDQSKDEPEVKEKVTWMPPINRPELSEHEMMMNWCCIGPRKLSLDNENHFCPESLLQNVLKSKSVFDILGEKEKNQARNRSNPYESIGNMFFQNRAALKMANLDAVFDFMFTDPKDEDGSSSVKPNEILYFADVCAAPGGFSEYVLWRRKRINQGFCDCKGFGFTLKSNDFCLSKFLASSPSYLEPHYGATQDGDIFVSENIQSFRQFVIQQTNGSGVHFMMADGGFSVDGNNNIQEILSKQLYLCQAAVALGILREGGHFVCKLFDVFTPFSVGLVYILASCFKKVSIHKPNTSRPANSERYIICKWLRNDTQWAYDYLMEVNTKLNDCKGTDQDVNELVPLQVLKLQEDFASYVCHSNMRLAERQIIALDKIRMFCQDVNLNEPRQSQIKAESLLFWQIPEQYRRNPWKVEPEETIAELLKPLNIEARFLPAPENSLTVPILQQIHTPLDYQFVVLGTKQSKRRGFFLSQGRNKCFFWNGIGEIHWEPSRVPVDLPGDTLVYAECVKEYDYDLRVVPVSLHLIDGLVLNGFPIANLPLHERHVYLRKFATATNRATLTGKVANVRCKTLFPFADVNKIVKGESFWERGGCRYFSGDEPSAGCDEIIYVPEGILLLKTIRDPYMFGFSRSRKKLYYYHTATRVATFEPPLEAISTFLYTRYWSICWWWGNGVKITDQDTADSDKIHLETVNSLMAAKFPGPQ